MKLSIIFCCILFLFSGAEAQQGYIDDFKIKWENAAEYTIECAELMPEAGYDYKPTPEQRTFKEQLLHMVGNMMWLSTSHFGGKGLDKDLENTDYSKTEIIEILNTAFKLSTQSISSLDPSELNDEVDFFIQPMNKRQILTLMNDHLTHHRGQAIVYLRLQGVVPPRYRGW